MPSGEFKKVNANVKAKARAFVDVALDKGAIANAATPSHHASTYYADANFHFDRQQPTNAQGDHKVAVQMNKGKSPTTIGQVLINERHTVAPKTVASTVKHSINIGPPDLRVPDSLKAQRIAKDDAARLAKQQRDAATNKAAMARAAAGNTKKGGK